MYPVSDAFMQAIKSNTRKYYWTGMITTSDKKTYEFGNEDIVKGSGYISRQCCGNSELEFGSVYAAELGISLFCDIDRYTLDGAEIKLWFHLLLTMAVRRAFRWVCSMWPKPIVVSKHWS